MVPPVDTSRGESVSSWYARQGEDVVAGIRTPDVIDRLAKTLPSAYEELIKNCDILEAHYKDMQVCACTWRHCHHMLNVNASSSCIMHQLCVLLAQYTSSTGQPVGCKRGSASCTCPACRRALFN